MRRPLGSRAQVAVLSTAIRRLHEARENERVGSPNSSPSYLVETHWINLVRELGE
jgi:hypothetical protein